MRCCKPNSTPARLADDVAEFLFRKEGHIRHTVLCTPRTVFLSSSSCNVLCQDHVQYTCLSQGLPQRHIARDNSPSLLPQTQTGSETLVQQPPDFLIYWIKIWCHYGALQCKSQLGRFEGFAQAYYITTNVHPSPWSVS